MSHSKLCTTLICLFSLIGLVHISPAAAEEGNSNSTITVPPPGYELDDRGRLMRTSFDLSSRYYLGVYDMLRIYENQERRWDRHSLLIEVGGTYEFYDAEESVRHRNRYAEGRLSLAPFELSGLVYGYDMSRSSDEAPLWITTFIGEPRRFDIPIAIGGGYSIGRIYYRHTEVDELMLLDLGEAHINWEFFQGRRLQNYLFFTTGAGVGILNRKEAERVDFYAAPEVGVRGSWTVARNGLTQVGFHGRMQWAWSVDSGHWKMGSFQAKAEWSPLAINDQPLTLFLAPEVRYSDIPQVELQGLEARAIIGLRLNLFNSTAAAELEQSQ